MRLIIANYLRVASIIIEAGLVDHAKEELGRAGLFDKDSDYGGLIGDAVMELCKKFSEQDHSGFSAGMVLSLFETLAKYKTLTPVTSDPKEWNDVSEMSGEPTWQSKRSPTIFSKDCGKTWYDIDKKASNRMSACPM